ncbi:hypothetical protein, partial [Streptomyces ardesiacus]|uniref:hypothetical protein n=1 Tax=Streptomyces ardesiacus TaxID=285564 RepID=UPI0033F81F2D
MTLQGAAPARGLRERLRSAGGHGGGLDELLDAGSARHSDSHGSTPPLGIPCRGAMMWTPVLNNIVIIVTLGMFIWVYGTAESS